ncbi:hypothetical protein GCM10023221_26450 [Luteimicrobium xylanilyticum]|uniref:Uncharacterized protein n=1 Tax=Luteimicrobium xylanilyticum TaxID=1133546 RepID=A0A5P9QFF3_9MICO|nr:hypothetical protein [Luteimicrobium xylanilyticum]QFU99770.1 hypothetical protein KDY119_03306 [Luteimicrobium xylanilyticum]
MTIPDALDLPDLPLTTDEDVTERVRDVVGCAARRQLWLFFLDADDCQLPVLLPIPDFPPSPDGGNAEQLAASLAALVEELDAAQVVVVWERRLDDRATTLDRAWATRLAEACRVAGVRLRGQLLSHRRGVRWLVPDELVGR